MFVCCEAGSHSLHVPVAATPSVGMLSGMVFEGLLASLKSKPSPFPPVQAEGDVHVDIMDPAGAGGQYQQQLQVSTFARVLKK